MRWVFTDYELAQGDEAGDLVRALFLRMKPLLERDEMLQRWITKSISITIEVEGKAIKF